MDNFEQISGLSTSAEEQQTVTEATDTEAVTEEIRFFDGDVSFDTPESYDPVPDQRKKIRSAFSITHFSLFIYLLTSQGVSTVLLLICAAVLASAEALNALSLDTNFLLGLNAVCQYAIAFPLLFLITRFVKKNPNTEKKKLSVKQFLTFFVVAEGFMLLASITSNLISTVFDKLLGVNSDGSIDSIINISNPILIIVSVCVLAPVFEELIFRKIVIDRLSTFGDGIAIVFSAVAFGLFHGNISQLIYATAVGLVLGYVYTQTRKIGYTVILHAMLNFIGGVLPLGVEWIMRESERLKALTTEGADVNLVLLSLYNTVIIAYDAMIVHFILGAIAIFVVALVRKKIKVQGSADYRLGTVIKAGTLNFGFISFAILSSVLIFISLLTA